MPPAEIARRARAIRRHVIRMIAPMDHGYVAQGLGGADLFATLLFAELRLDPSNPAWPDRDRFILSTAHNSAAFHAALAERGFIPPARLADYCADGSPLEINVSERLGPPVETTCGSLGQGLSVGLGMALAARRRGQEWRTYVLLGDGEMQEGQVWEAAMAAGSFGLDNLCLVVDLNWMQVEGHADNVLRMDPVAAKWAAFGWEVQTIDGNDIPAILGAFDHARATRGKPSAIIATTLPGCGVSFFENVRRHTMTLTPGGAERALAELEA
jgi:transketolase